METTSAPKLVFPAGLRVMLVDDDPLCLKIVEKMLQTCQYSVTTCTKACEALSLLRARDDFDIVLSDVYMPDMDGFKLLETIGLELDLPVIMISANSETTTVLRGITHGAVDFLLKPVRIEELRNIWQHVVRKKHLSQERSRSSGSRGDDEEDSVSSDSNKKNRERKRRKDEEESKEEEPVYEEQDLASGKRARVVWTVELHQQFVDAVNQLGVDKAVPKRILDIMNVKGLTRENVASHLQKYRLYLKRLNEVRNHSEVHPPMCMTGLDMEQDLMGFGLLHQRNQTQMSPMMAPPQAPVNFTPHAYPHAHPHAPLRALPHAHPHAHLLQQQQRQQQQQSIHSPLLMQAANMSQPASLHLQSQLSQYPYGVLPMPSMAPLQQAANLQNYNRVPMTQLGAISSTDMEPELMGIPMMGGHQTFRDPHLGPPTRRARMSAPSLMQHGMRIKPDEVPFGCVGLSGDMSKLMNSPQPPGAMPPLLEMNTPLASGAKPDSHSQQDLINFFLKDQDPPAEDKHLFF